MIHRRYSSGWVLAALRRCHLLLLAPCGPSPALMSSSRSPRSSGPWRTCSMTSSVRAGLHAVVWAHPLHRSMRPPAETAAPTLAHLFFAALDADGRLLRLYTQNVDGLDERAGVSPARVVQAHGTLATVSCLRCGRRFPAAHVREDVAARTVARCRGPPACGGLLKPDAVFFHESLPAAYASSLDADLAAADLCVVVGSSMRVRPVSDIPGRLPPHVPLLVVNLEPLGPQIDAAAAAAGAAGARGAGSKRPRAAPTSGGRRPSSSGKGGGGGFPHAPDVQLLGRADTVCRLLWAASGIRPADLAAAMGASEQEQTVAAPGTATAAAADSSAPGGTARGEVASAVSSAAESVDPYPAAPDPGPAAHAEVLPPSPLRGPGAAADVCVSAAGIPRCFRVSSERDTEASAPECASAALGDASRGMAPAASATRSGRRVRAAAGAM